MPTQVPDSWHFDKRVPVALILCCLGQGSLGIWWFSDLNSQVQTHEKRLTKLESISEKQVEILGTMNERLARIEESIAYIKLGIFPRGNK